MFRYPSRYVDDSHDQPFRPLPHVAANDVHSLMDSKNRKAESMKCELRQSAPGLQDWVNGGGRCLGTLFVHSYEVIPFAGVNACRDCIR